MRLMALTAGILTGIALVAAAVLYEHHAPPPETRPAATQFLPLPPPQDTEGESTTPVLSAPIIDSNLTLEAALGDADIRRNLMVLDVQYYGFDNLLHQGQLVVHQAVAAEVSAIFAELKEHYVLIGKMLPVSEYGYQDEASMQDNNTSAFNYRRIRHSRKLSNHAYGLAIDINPLYNPFVGRGRTLPDGATYDPHSPYAITRSSAVYEVFTRYGWRWGGNWRTVKDYQHFEKPGL